MCATIEYMTIPEATVETVGLSSRDRSRHSFYALTASVARKETGEPFTPTSMLREAGFLIEPFWETPHDVEGDCYGAYIEQHPDFTLITRRGVYERLRHASSLLPGHWNIVLKAGFRPLEVQTSVLQAFIEESRVQHPSWSDEEHLAHARLFVADPNVVCPPHTTGGAVDVDIKDKNTGQYIDMGCPINTDDEIAFLHSDQLTSAQYENRMTLLDAMLAAGFAPNVNEWWHYQYGETYWAAFYGHDETIYDSVA